MDTQQEHSGTEKKTRLWGILPKRLRTVRSGKPIRPVSLLIATLATLAVVLGVIGFVVPVGSVQATPGEGSSTEVLGRITLGPFSVNQPPDFMIQSGNEKDVAITTVTLAEGGHSGWHTHPGVTIAIVTEGKVSLTRFTEEDGCIVQVFGPDELEQGFVEGPNEVHIAENVGEGPAVLQTIRLNFPVGADIADFSPEEPECSD